MKILFIHNEYQQIGGEDVAFHLEKEVLLRAGHEVHSLVFSNKWDSEQDSKWVAAKNAIYNKTAAQLVSDKIERTRPDIVHVHNIFFRASPSILFACKEKRIPVVMTLHNYRLICSNALLLRDSKICEACTNKTLQIPGILHKCYRQSYAESMLVAAFSGFHKISGTWKKKVDKYIVLTEFARQKILYSSLGLREDQLIVKPNYSPDYGVGAIERQPYYLYVGRLSSEKGIDSMLKAVAETGVTLLLVGEGPEQKRLMAEFASYGNIRFLGQQDRRQVVKTMQEAKALIFPSIWFEGLPFTIIEAFSTGTPVLASRLGAMGELIRDGVNGFHFEAGNYASIAAAIKKFEQIDSIDMYKQARLSYENSFTVEKHYQSIMKIYQSVLNAN